MDSNQPTNPLPTSEKPAPSRTAEDAIARGADGLVTWIARHWLALFNTAWGLYVFLPFLAPVFMQMGWMAPARLIYGLYSFTCHQLPDHSYFLFGNQFAPLAPDLARSGLPEGLGLFQQRQFVGNSDAGFKVALCQRDVAIYGSVFVGGLLYALLRKRTSGISLKLYALLLIPMAIDGLTQLFGLRESNWWLRSVTGAIFGVASVWLAYPLVNDAMEEVVENQEARTAAR